MLRGHTPIIFHGIEILGAQIVFQEILIKDS